MTGSIRTVVVDDETLAREGATAMVTATDGFEVVAQCADGESAVTEIDRLKPDLVLLDVQMPRVSGIDVVARIGTEQMPPVIFITAFDKFAVDAFELNALDYILKPFTDARFASALNRAAKALRDRSNADLGERYNSLISELEAARTGSPDNNLPRNPTRLEIRATGAINFVDVDDIEWIEADSYYAKIHANGKRTLIRESMLSLAARLDDRFMRVHRSAIVRVDHIRELRRDSRGELSKAVLQSGAIVPISRGRAVKLTARLQR